LIDREPSLKNTPVGPLCTKIRDLTYRDLTKDDLLFIKTELESRRDSYHLAGNTSICYLSSLNFSLHYGVIIEKDTNPPVKKLTCLMDYLYRQHMKVLTSKVGFIKNKMTNQSIANTSVRRAMSDLDSIIKN
jgi:hypothetical protein